ncbi:MAG: LOG family protein [Candidatus Taylorbacteria bacterium]|nr:LOG family protein [Candidatus Taylorbacteria bacterium]
MKYKFVVSGAANMSFCCSEADKKAYQIGQEIVRQDGILITGATTGIPHQAAKGAKDEGGISIGISPAATYAAHVKSYRLPIDYYDFIIYSGFDYSGRNLILTKAADAVIIVCGGFGTLNEFTIALEDDKPIGVLSGTCGASDQIYGLLKNIKDPHHHGAGKLVFSGDPKELIAGLIEIIDRERKDVKIELPVGE